MTKACEGGVIESFLFLANFGTLSDLGHETAQKFLFISSYR